MSKTVMIVEDFVDVRSMMSILVRWQGYEVVQAIDGYEAIKKSIEAHPDLILMDLALPLMDGVTAAKIIRRLEGFEKTSIVAVTAYGNTYYDKAVEAGFDDLIIKPLHFENLEPLLNYYLA